MLILFTKVLADFNSFYSEGIFTERDLQKGKTMNFAIRTAINDFWVQRDLVMEQFKNNTYCMFLLTVNFLGFVLQVLPQVSIVSIA